ncbi:MAG TPA: hypothetical protein VF323_08030 [Candidatus Limnocylindrales bacterium]
MKPRRVAALLLVSLALAACAAAPGPTAPPGSDPTAAARLLVRLDGGAGAYPGSPAIHVADYLTDGTVIRKHAGVLEIDRLTEAGLATVVSTLTAATDLLATPVRIAPRSTVLPADSTGNMPMGIVEAMNSFVLERPDGTRYTVSAPSRPRTAGDPSPDPTVEGLTALADALRDPEALVGSGGLAGPWEPYQPAKMGVFLILESLNDPQIINDGVVPHVGPTDWTFANPPLTFGTVFKGPGDHVTRRCALLPSQEVAAAMAHMSRFGGRFTEGDAASHVAAGFIWNSGVLLWVDGDQATSVSMQALALMPEDGAASCIDALSY